MNDQQTEACKELGRRLAKIGPDIADMLCTDPAVADLLDPAVIVYTEGEENEIHIVEQLQVIEFLANENQLDDPSGHRDLDREKLPILIAMVGDDNIATYVAADPRIVRGVWPWRRWGDENDD